MFSSPTVSAEPKVALSLMRGQRRRLQAAAAAATAEAEAAAVAEAEAEAAAAEEARWSAAAGSSPDLPRPPPADRVIRTLTRLTESFTVLEVAVRLAGHKGGACVRVPIRRAWAWSDCLAEVQSRLLEASAIGKGVQVTALRAAVPPYARVVRAADLAPGEVLEALLDGAESEAMAEVGTEEEAAATLEAMMTKAGVMAVPPTGCDVGCDVQARAQRLAAAPCRLAATPRASPFARVVAVLVMLVAVAAITYGGAAGETGEHGGAHGDGRSSLTVGEAAEQRVICTLPAAFATNGSGEALAVDSLEETPEERLEEGMLTGVPSPFGCAFRWPNNCRALDPERATCTFRTPSSRAQGACLASSLL